MVANLIDSTYFFLGLYSLILILIGTPLNLLCFYIFKRSIPNRSNSTIIVFSYLSLIELLIPFTWNLNYVIRELHFKQKKHITITNLEQSSLFICKLISFGAYFSLQCAAWLKTLAAFTRCVSLHHDWSIQKYLSKSSIAHRLVWMIIVLLGLINSPIWIVNGAIRNSTDQLNRTVTQIKCYQSIFFQYWEIVHLLLYNFIPFILMILCNISIIRQVHDSRRRTQRSKIRSRSLHTHNSSISFSSRRSFAKTGLRLSRTLISVTIFFIVFTSPSAIFYISLGKIIKRHRNLITMFLSNLATMSHVLSFLIYWLTSSDFQTAAMGFLCCRSIEGRRKNLEEKHLDQSFVTRRLSPTMIVIQGDNQRKPSQCQFTLQPIE